MAKRRLKKVEKVGIVWGLLKKLTIDRHEALIAKQQALGLEIYEALYAATEKKILDALGGMSKAKGHLRRVTQADIAPLSKDGKSLASYGSVDVPPLYAQDRERPSRQEALLEGSDRVELGQARLMLEPTNHGGVLTLKAPKKFWKRIEQLQAEIQAHEKLYYETQMSLAGVVDGCTYVEQLLELLPEAEEFVPAPDAPALAMVPVGAITKLREQLQQVSNNAA